MRKFLTALNFVLLITLIILTLYVFDVIDIPWLRQDIQEPQEHTQERVPVRPEPDDEEEDRVARRKSYTELMNRGDLYLKNGFYNLAIDAYVEASNQEPDNISPLIKIANVHLATKNHTQARDVSLEVLKTAPQSTDAKLVLGKAYLELEKFNDAKNIFDGITIDDQEVLYYKGITALYFEEYDRGRNLLNETIQKATDDNITEKAQSFINAMNEFNRYQAGQKNHMKVLLARSFVQSYHPLIAKELLWSVLQQQRHYRDAWIILGYSYLQIQQFQEAVDALEEARKQGPGKPQTLFYLGLAYAGNDQIDEAIEVLNLALENGYHPRVHVEQKLAELYFQKEEYEKAGEKYENVLDLNATNLDYFVRPIWIYIDVLKSPKKALALAEKAHLHHPNEPMAHNLLGWAYVANRDFINGRKYLERSIELNDEFDAPHLNLGWMYEKQNNFKKAMEYYKKAFDLGRGTAIGNLAASRYNALVEREKDQNIMVNIFNF